MAVPAAVLIDPAIVHRLLAAQIASVSVAVEQIGEEEEDASLPACRHTALEITPRQRRTGDDTHFADFSLIVVVSADPSNQRPRPDYITTVASQIYGQLCDFIGLDAGTTHTVNVLDTKIDITEGPDIHGNAQAVITATGDITRVSGNSITAVP